MQAENIMFSECCALYLHLMSGSNAIIAQSIKEDRIDSVSHSIRSPNPDVKAVSYEGRP